MHEHSLRVFNLMLLDGHVEEKLTDTIFFNDTKNKGCYPSWELATIGDFEYHIQNFYSHNLQMCEANIGNSAIHWVSFFCWCGWCFRGLRKCVFKVYGMVGPDAVCKFGFAAGI